MKRYLPFADLKAYRLRSLHRDVLAGLAVSSLDIPQGLAYATVAGLPPVMGLYAAALPAIVGALFRSSHHVITGPSNALSLLVSSAVASVAAHNGATPMAVGITLAFMVGVMQFVAGLLRLDTLADYISQPVLRGYITGAAVLIAVGQLPNITATTRSNGDLLHTLSAWAAGLPQTNPLTVAFALGTAVSVLLLRRINAHLPGSIIALVLGGSVSEVLQLHAYGLRSIADLAPIPAGLPPFTIPQVGDWAMLAPAAAACAVLSLVESSSVARAIAAQTGQKLDLAAEFSAQGLANLAAAFSGGYPVSGSLARSMLNLQAGAASRLSGVFCGLMMLMVLLFLSPLVSKTPIASLAGLLLILAYDLIDRERIRMILHGTSSDRAAFISTILGTWFLPLDKAIYLGVGISLVLFLRQARLLTIREMVISEKGRFREVDSDPAKAARSCRAICILNLTGPLFFAAAGELQSALDRISSDPQLRVLILRLRQAQNLDVTTAGVVEAADRKLKHEGKTLLLLGMRRPAMQLFEEIGLIERVGRDNFFPAQAGWFTAMEAALCRALTLAGEHACGTQCPLVKYLMAQDTLRSTTPTSTVGVD